MPKRVLQGKVVSVANDKTATILVERRVTHPLYGKILRRSKKYHAHDAENRCELGDAVRIQECVPISKSKNWQVIDGATGEAKIRVRPVKEEKPKKAAKKPAAKKATAKKIESKAEAKPEVKKSLAKKDERGE